MKNALLIATFIALIIACNSNKIAILDKGYLGMTTDEYAKVFKNNYELNATSAKVRGRLDPGFTSGRLTSLSVSVDDISDYDTAYTVYELGNDFNDSYGLPYENMETVWAGGIEKRFKWHKGKLEVEYSYRYNQVPGTSGLLYTGAAKVAYRERRDVN